MRIYVSYLPKVNVLFEVNTLATNETKITQAVLIVRCRMVIPKTETKIIKLNYYTVANRC